MEKQDKYSSGKQLLRRNKVEKIGLLLLTIHFFGQTLQAQQVKQDNYAVFQNHTKDNGLSDNTINAIYQDNEGFVWIGTENGLNRFDGYDFIVFEHADKDSCTLSGNTITDIEGDKSGNLWVATTAGLNQRDGKHNCFKKIAIDHEQIGSAGNIHIRKLALQNDSILWIESLNGRLTRMNTRTGVQKHFTHAQVSQPYYRYHALKIMNDTTIWLGGRNIAIHIFNSKSESFRLIYADPENPNRKRDNDLASALQTSKGQIFISGIDGFYRIDPITEKTEKLLATSTYALIELQNGRIALGTAAGLFIFDPITNGFIRYLNDIDNPASIVGNKIYSLMQDKAGNIWAGTTSGLSVYRANESDFEHFFHIPGNSATLSANAITDILQDKNANIWIGTEHHGLNLWDTVSNSFRQFMAGAPTPQGITSNKVSCLYEDQSGTIFVGYWAGLGFDRLDPVNLTFKRFAISPTTRKQDWYSDFAEDKQGRLWLGLWGSSGIQAFDRKQEKFDKFNYNAGKTPVEKPITGLLADSEQNIWVLTPFALIYKYNTRLKEFTSYTNNQNKSTLAAPNTHQRVVLPDKFENIHAFATDNVGNVIFAGNAGFLHYIQESDSFGLIPHHLSPVTKLLFHPEDSVFYAFSSNQILMVDQNFRLVSETNHFLNFDKYPDAKIFAGNKGNIWTVIGDTLFSYLTKNKTTDKTVLPDFETNEAFAISECKELIYSLETGIHILNLNNNARKTHLIKSPQHSTLLRNTTSIIAINKKEILFISTSGFALFNRDLRELKTVHLKQIPENYAFNANFTTNINNRIFLAEKRDIHELNLTTKALKKINNPGQYNLASRLTTNLLTDYDGFLWIATSNAGLSRLNLNDNTFVHFGADTTPNSLPHNTVNTLYQHDSTDIWIGTNAGLVSINTQNLSITRPPEIGESYQIKSITGNSDIGLWIGTNKGLWNYWPANGKAELYDKTTGLPAENFGRGACQLQNGKIVMATNNGIIKFDPKNINSKKHKNRVKISDIDLFNNHKKLHILSGDTLNLDFSSNYFKIGFTNLDFGNRNVVYAYQISGMSDNWIYTSDNQAVFSNLQPGNYIFRVTLAGHEENTELHSLLNINIKPPFYKTNWFYMLSFIVVSGIIAGFILAYTQQLRIRSRNARLEQKLLSSQMNPHFIANSLAAIQKFMYKREPEVAGNYLSGFARLVRLILENSRAENISLEKEIQTLRLYLNLQQLRFEDKFTYQIQVDDTINQRMTLIPPMLAQPFIENSIEHGIMHLVGKGCLEIAFKKTSGYIEICITDDGIGHKKSQEINQNRKKFASLATAITRERLENLSKKFGESYTIEISDKSPLLDDTGTKVTLKIPYKLKNINKNQQFEL